MELLHPHKNKRHQGDAHIYRVSYKSDLFIRLLTKHLGSIMKLI